MGLARRPFPTRRLIVLALTTAPTTGFAAPCPATKVLFVCPAGTVKSAIAREMLRSRVQTEGLAVIVASRGLKPEDHVSVALASNLHADGLDPTREPALALAPADVAGADVVVAFDEAAGSPLLSKARAWRTPSWNADYAAAKADLATRLDDLIAELRARKGGCR